MNSLVIFALVGLAVSSSADQLQSYNLPNQGGGFSSGGFISGGSSEEFHSGGSFSSGGGSFISGGGSFSNGGGSFSSGGGSFSSGGGSFSSGDGSFSSGGGSFSSGGGSFSSGSGFSSNVVSGFNGFSASGCGRGEVRKADGTCARAEITRNIYLYAAPPAQQVDVRPAGPLPNPKVHYNFVFVRTPERFGGARPIVVPPPQQKTLVYVLSKRPSAQDQEVIEVPSTPTQPEVFFVNYNQGDNPDLPGGISLQQALSQSTQQGQFIDGGAGSGGIDLRGGFSSGGNSAEFISGNFGGGFISGGNSGEFISGGSSGGSFSSGGFIDNDNSLEFLGVSSGIVQGGYSTPN